MQTISRRSFLKTTAAVSAAAISPAHLFAAGVAPKEKTKPSLGVQLYSVRKDCTKDLPGTLNAVGKMGYKAVEFAGYYGRDAKTLRKLLDEAGLKCCGSHIHIPDLTGAELEKTVEFNKTLGNPNLMVASMPPKKTKEDWEKAAD